MPLFLGAAAIQSAAAKLVRRAAYAFSHRVQGAQAHYTGAVMNLTVDATWPAYNSQRTWLGRGAQATLAET